MMLDDFHDLHAVRVDGIRLIFPQRRRTVPVADTWKKVRTTTTYKGFVTINRATYEEPSGVVTNWDVIAGRDSAATLAFTPAASHVVLFEQFRVGPEKALLELPGGVPE